MRKMAIAVAACTVVPIALAGGQQSSREPKEKAQNSASDGSAHDSHSATMERGEKGMGFSQSATTHHFFMKSNGGAIQVEANDAADAAERDHVRMHLKHITQAFASGDFDIPMFVHDTVPPGVPEMKRLREKIRYSYEETAAGGRVVIATADKESLIAIHKFLRFQIEEHKTGDPTEIK